jgi:polygalacturonase
MRRLLSCLAAAVLLLGLVQSLSATATTTAAAGAAQSRARQRARVASRAAVGWDAVPAILARIRPPRFPARDFPITDFGAREGGSFDNTEAIRRAIEACNRAGGGRVVVPAGTFLTGAIHLKSNVNLHVSEGATLRFSTDPAKYLPAVFTRWEGTELMNYSPLIYAFEQRNIAVTGKGTLDGGASDENWWK